MREIRIGLLQPVVRTLRRGRDVNLTSVCCLNETTSDGHSNMVTSESGHERFSFRTSSVSSLGLTFGGRSDLHDLVTSSYGSEHVCAYDTRWE